MQKFYFDLAKICFGVGFYGCLSKVQDPVHTVVFAVLSLTLTLVFGLLGYKESEE